MKTIADLIGYEILLQWLFGNNLNKHEIMDGCLVQGILMLSIQEYCLVLNRMYVELKLPFKLGIDKNEDL